MNDRLDRHDGALCSEMFSQDLPIAAFLCYGLQVVAQGQFVGWAYLQEVACNEYNRHAAEQAKKTWRTLQA